MIDVLKLFNTLHISFKVTISTAENSHAFFESEPYRNHGDKKDYKNVENLKVNIIEKALRRIDK